MSIVVNAHDVSYMFEPLFDIGSGIKVSPTTRDGVSISISNNKVQRQHPNVVFLNTPRSMAMAAKFRSMAGKPIVIWFDNGADGIIEGTLHQGQETTTNTYVGHVFYFTRETGRASKGKEIARITIVPDKVSYIIYDNEDPAPGSLIAQQRKEDEFMEEYHNRTGIQWR